MTVLNLVH